MLSNEGLESFWDALWLELWPFLYFIVESRRTACRCLQTKRGAICYRMSVSTPSGTPCGSSYGRFSIFILESRKIACRCLQTKRGAMCYRITSRHFLGRPVARAMAISVFYLRNLRKCLLTTPNVMDYIPGVTPCPCPVFAPPPLCCRVQLWGHFFGFLCPPPITGVLGLLGLGCGIRG